MLDTVLRVVTPDGISFDLHPAGPLPRFAAFLLDGLIEFCVLIILFTIAALVGLTSPWVFTLTSFGVLWFYMVFFEMISGGRSPGKRVLGLQVVQRDGTPVVFGASLLRNLLRFADFVALLGLVVPLFTSGFRRLGDLAAGTLVVYVPERLEARGRRHNFRGVEARPPQRILEGEASVAALEFARRREDLGPGLRRELAELALPVYLLDPETVDEAETALVGVAAWYAGLRPGQEERGA